MSSPGFASQEVPMDEARAEETDRIVNVYHFSKETNRAHGVPFKFILKPVSPLFEQFWQRS